MLRHVYLCVPVLRLRFLGLAAFNRAGLSMFGFWLLGLALCGLDMRGLDLIGRREHLVVCRFFRRCVQLGAWCCRNTPDTKFPNGLFHSHKVALPPPSFRTYVIFPNVIRLPFVQISQVLQADAIQ